MDKINLVTAEGKVLPYPRLKLSDAQGNTCAAYGGKGRHIVVTPTGKDGVFLITGTSAVPIDRPVKDKTSPKKGKKAGKAKASPTPVPVPVPSVDDRLSKMDSRIEDMAMMFSEFIASQK